MDFFLLGRFHPLLVHLPIGILLIAFLFELLSHIKRYRKLKSAVRPALFVGGISAVASALSGYWLSQEGGYDEHLLRNHQYLGIATALFSVLVYLHRKYSIIPDKSQRKVVRLIFFFVLVLLLTITGHQGGSLTHGEDFLLSPKSEMEATPVSKSIANPQKALVFEDVVRPILAQKCFGCHSAKKQKGQLRLDSREWVEQGGKHGAVLVAGKPAESELFRRLALSIEIEHHMPPRERTQLTSLEMDVIENWIEEGASFDKRVQELQHPEVILEWLGEESSVSGSGFPTDEVAAADTGILEGLKKTGVVMVPIATHSNYLKASFAYRKKIAPEEAAQLRKISKNIVDLDLSGCTLSGEVMNQVIALQELRNISLRGSGILDADLLKISVLKKLTSLNLAFTSISDQAIPALGGIGSLKKIFLFQSAVTETGIANLSKLLPGLQIDTGNYQLPFIPSDTTIYKRSK